MISSIQALGRDLTIVMIAHRVSTLNECDMIVEIRQGSIAGVQKFASQPQLKEAHQ